MYRIFFLLIAFALHSGAARAVDYCVGSAAQLQSALNQAEDDNANSVIRIKAGTYALASDLRYEPQYEGILVTGELIVRGGYNADCSARNGETTITSTSGNIMYAVTQFGSVRLRDLIFNGVNVFVRSLVSGPCSGSVPPFEINRLRISNAFLESSTQCQDVDIRDSVFVNGQPSGEFSDLSLRVYLATTDNYRFPKLTMVNSTVQNGLTAITNCCDGQPNARIYNSIFSRSGNEFVNEVNLFLYNNRYDGITNRSGGNVSLAQDNTSAVANLDAQFVPNPGSAMINSGTSTVPGGLSDVDVYGGDRTIGPRVDRGAAESPVDGTGIYTVTNNGSSGSGSLANAINAANLDSADNVIRFNIPGGCPQRIVVSPGIEIRDQLRIDGNSQPGSVANSTNVGWNAAPCIILDGINYAGTALTTAGALSTNNESVDISGLAFERFDAAILLSFGIDHRVRGNQFGGRVGISGPVLRGNNNAILVAGEGRSLIGGAGIQDVNLISDSAEAGVLITGLSSHDNYVVGNLIGLDKNGLAALPNQDGVRINSNGNVVSFNLIGGNTRDGVVLRTINAYDNVVEQNRLGSIASAGLIVPPRNGRFGVLLEESAHNNRIEQNTIGRNGDSGVRVLSTAAGYNLISNNAIDRNGAIGIDLGANGVTDNDVDPLLCNINTGCAANGELNFPVLDSAVLRPSGIIPLNTPLRIQGRLMSTVRTAPYRIEFYASDACDASGHGQGERFVGSKSLVISSSGFCSNNNCSASFSVFVPEIDAAIGDYISAIAISPSGDTSEFSACIPVTNEPQTGPIFANGFE
jgi:hypothetical protein